jgi:hypothetical protein
MSAACAETAKPAPVNAIAAKTNLLMLLSHAIAATARLACARMVCARRTFMVTELHCFLIRVYR